MHDAIVPKQYLERLITSSAISRSTASVIVVARASVRERSRYCQINATMDDIKDEEYGCQYPKPQESP